MKRLLKFAAAALLCAGTAFASTSNVTATITDSDGQTWNNGTWTAVLVSPKGTPTISGVPAFPLTSQGNLSGSGTLNTVLLDTGSIDQTGATWTFTICPNASVSCSAVSGIAVTGASPNLSAALSSAITAPRFQTGPTAYGYRDAEAIPTSSHGASYFNVTLKTQSYWDGNTWTSAGGGGAASTILSQIPTNGLIGLYTHTDCSNPY